MAVYVVTANNLERMSGTPTLSASADANNPATNLYARVPSSPLVIGSAATDLTITFDQNETTNGGFETASPALDGWTEASVGASNVTARTTTAGEFNAGAAGMKMTIATTGASNLAGRYTDEPVRAGETVYLTGALRGDGTVTARIQVRNLDTGKYLTSGGAWQAAATDWYTRSTATYATQGPSAVVIESLPTGQYELASMTLRILCYVDGSATGDGFVDDVYLWPASDFISIHGHNLTPRVAVQIRRSTDNFAGSDTQEGADITAFPQAFFLAFGAVRSERYIRVKVVGTPKTALVFGQMVLGQKLSLAKGFAYPELIDREEIQVRVGSRSYLERDRITRGYTLAFNWDTAAQFTEMVSLVWGGSRGGHHPIVLVPDPAESHVIYGRIEATGLTTRRVVHDSTGDFWEETQYRIVELPLPTLIP